MRAFEQSEAAGSCLGKATRQRRKNGLSLQANSRAKCLGRGVAASIPDIGFLATKNDPSEGSLSFVLKH